MATAWNSMRVVAQAAPSQGESMDYTPRITNVKDQVGFDPVTTMPAQSKVVTFMVGHHGPFTLNYRHAEYSAERVNADIAAQVATLRAIGAIS